MNKHKVVCNCCSNEGTLAAAPAFTHVCQQCAEDEKNTASLFLRGIKLSRILDTHLLRHIRTSRLPSASVSCSGFTKGGARETIFLMITKEQPGIFHRGIRFDSYHGVAHRVAPPVSKYDI